MRSPKLGTELTVVIVQPRRVGACPHRPAGLQFNKKSGVQISTPPEIKNRWSQAAVLRGFALSVFLSRFAANSLATAFWSFFVSTQ